MAVARRIWRTLIEIAVWERQRALANHPSPTCCIRQRLVEAHDDVWIVGVEVGGRIVEREVAVFADADEGDVDGSLEQ